MEKRQGKWGIVGIAQGAGSSFLTAVLAGYLAAHNGRPAVLELGNGVLYDALGLGRHFSYTPYRSPYDVVREDGCVRQVTNVYKGINWAVQTEEDRKQRTDFRESLRLIHNIDGDPLLCDFSGRTVVGEGGEDTWHLLREMDRVFVVIDPLPSRLLMGAAALAKFRLSQLPLTYVINKDNEGIDRKELKAFLCVAPCHWIPMVNSRWIYAAEYGCKDPYSVMEIARVLTPALDKLVGGQ